ncbi:MAG: hypothetical protein L3K13_08240, partial [Thermoplasmata archaeon]|nr:hypothetical protein [Thermoplasmata archaeon]
MDRRIVAVGVAVLLLGAGLLLVPIETRSLTNSVLSDGSVLNFTVTANSELFPTPLRLHLSWGESCLAAADVLRPSCPPYNFTLYDCGVSPGSDGGSCRPIGVSATSSVGSTDEQVAAGHSYGILAKGGFPPNRTGGGVSLSVTLTEPALKGWLGVGLMFLGAGAVLFGVRRRFPARAAPPPP